MKKKMRIDKRRIRNVELYIGDLGEGARFRLSSTIATPKQQDAAGFPAGAVPGTTVLPPARGPASRYNADGKWLPLKELPKEERYVRTVRWRWKEFCGRNQYVEREDFKDIYRLCYQRRHLPPPGIELTLATNDGSTFAHSPVFVKGVTAPETVRDAANLMLELFGFCDLVNEVAQPFRVPETHRLSWTMLPPGEYPWPRLQKILRGNLRTRSENTQAVIFDRQEAILQHKPTRTYVGVGGFSDYIAYEFPDRGLVVLESIRHGNAIYVFGQDWKRFARLSKAEIVAHGLHVERIVHSAGWKDRLARLLARARSA